mmetsp:Transcript_4045/g.5895  ORF Transcript_4045/g.5895 Transcript_4045/m.5895 type:complete len:90 (-) Transcript_4045:16-285(-)
MVHLLSSVIWRCMNDHIMIFAPSTIARSTFPELAFDAYPIINGAVDGRLLRLLMIDDDSDDGYALTEKMVTSRQVSKRCIAGDIIALGV